MNTKSLTIDGGKSLAPGLRKIEFLQDRNFCIHFYNNATNKFFRQKKNPGIFASFYHSAAAKCKIVLERRNAVFLYRAYTQKTASPALHESYAHAVFFFELVAAVILKAFFPIPSLRTFLSTRKEGRDERTNLTDEQCVKS